MDAPQFYNVDAGTKMTLATSVNQSPHLYAIMKSNTERFKEVVHDVPFAVYNLDVSNSKSLSSTCRDSRRFYASSFQSNVPRFPPPPVRNSADKVYDCSRTKNFQPDSLARDVEETSIKYSIHRSKYLRFPDKAIMSDTPNVIYNVDSGNKTSLYTSMVNSSQKYSIVGKSVTERSAAALRTATESLGPGSYDAKDYKDIVVSDSLHHKPLSSLSSTTNRFKNDAAIGIGTTWRQEKDTRAWARHGVTMPRATYLRPAYVPKILGTKEFQ
uniref:Flagellar associated protein n=1 Tax=Polytomella parva TaxID=51329 RepID=A0A7S0YTA4_9CHLO|mmetsp:Transcript_8072/g.15649  ORF Transcript_8072/g.15649 Transcript_8072/m.15649 type:complete len:270 (+) Transcript_8072:100-909(+)